ncbi:hypothetical protein [Actinoallomurus iriomotensis]|uniref:Uncharacterized protein n=1 Tax=Actinoallomurus iriomotensis TaxID=478107 RepID=A0A9W6S5I0_9ACTN|nr:hypothetical protein [Actinoallomurus iriomotensis]GLY87508.1 hypothetical protein Airi02_054370 [Actinoallomurus iriomotensis]
MTLYLDVREYQAIDDVIPPTTIPARSLGGRAVTVERGDRPSVAIIGHIPYRWLFGGGASLLGVLGPFVVDAGRGRSPGPVPVKRRSRPGSILVAQHATFAAPEVIVRTTPPPAPHVSLTGPALSACDLLSDGSIRAVFPRARIVSRAVTRYAESTFVPANGRCRIGLWLPHGDTGDRHGPSWRGSR